MKKLNQYRYLLLCFFFACLLLNNHLFAQGDSTPAKKIVRLHYYNVNNSMQYLVLESSLKKGKIISPQQNKSYELYLDTGTANLVAKLKTDENGRAKAFIPASLKSAWEASTQHNFTVKEGDDDVITDFVISKSKINIDTATTDGVKNITVSVMKAEKDKWIPAKDVEMKIGVERQGGILSAGDAATYTTDSTGSVTVEFKKDKLPGDEQGNIILAAKAEDNEFFGTLSANKKVTWGVPFIANKNFFDQRTLWSTRFKTPYWLLFMAYAIVIGVWGTIIYLVFQLIKIKKLSA
jgi:hypothetical protein